MLYGWCMDTKTPSEPLPPLSTKRRLLFLGIGGVLGILMEYTVLTAYHPAASIAIGLGLLAVAAVLSGTLPDRQRQ